MAGIVHIPWYATLFRSESFAEAIGEIAPLALRYGATSYGVYQSRDDLYRFLQTATFADKNSFDRYWQSEDFIKWRAKYTSWYHLPSSYGWHDQLFEGHIDAPEKTEDQDLLETP